jgi:flagella synthesis protein FlgN
MPAHELAIQLRALLSELSQQLARLQVFLQQENQALASGELDRVSELAHQKELTTNAIELCEQQRRKLLDHYQLGYDVNSMAQLSRHLPRELVRELAGVWQRIATKGQQCKEQNEINGIVLAHQQRRALTTLRILRGQTTHAELYSARGNSLTDFDQHSLARI